MKFAEVLTIVLWVLGGIGAIAGIFLKVISVLIGRVMAGIDQNQSNMAKNQEVMWKKLDTTLEKMETTFGDVFESIKSIMISQAYLKAQHDLNHPHNPNHGEPS